MSTLPNIDIDNISMVSFEMIYRVSPIPLDPKQCFSHSGMPNSTWSVSLPWPLGIPWFLPFLKSGDDASTGISINCIYMRTRLKYDFILTGLRVHHDSEHGGEPIIFTLYYIYVFPLTESNRSYASRCPGLPLENICSYWIDTLQSDYWLLPRTVNPIIIIPAFSESVRLIPVLSSSTIRKPCKLSCTFHDFILTCASVVLPDPFIPGEL